MKPIAQGYIISVHRKNFWCRLEYDGKSYDAEVSISKLSPRERSFLEEGAYISFLKGGSIRFNRVRWTKKDIADAEKRAKILLEQLSVTKP